MGRGAVTGDHEDWQLTIVQDVDLVVDDHPVRVDADSELGEGRAAVLTAVWS